MICQPLPAEEAEFFELLRIFFPHVYDIKYIMKKEAIGAMKGLQDTADELSVARIGQQHQAGSDSLLTLQTFFEMRQRYFEGLKLDEKYRYVFVLDRFRRS